MKTAHYTFTVENNGALAAGFDGAVDQERQSALVRTAGTPAGDENKVIDLTAWLEANQGGDQETAADGLDWTCGEYEDADEAEPELPAPRPRRSRRSMLTAELVSTISVVAVAAAIILRILTF